MGISVTDQDIQIQDIRLINNTIKEVYNYDFSCKAMYAYRKKLAGFIKDYGFQHISEFIETVKYNQKWFEKLLLYLNIKTTEMFRDPSFWRRLREILISFREKRRSIKIWMMGAGSGEELFSLLILLSENDLLNIANVTLTDIHSSILSEVKQGRLNKKDIEINQENYKRFQGKSKLKDHLYEKKDEWIFNSDLLNKVNFKIFRVNYDNAPSKFNVILCRNQMIFMNEKLQNDLLNVLANSIYEGGILGIGLKENLEKSLNAKKFQPLYSREKLYKIKH